MSQRSLMDIDCRKLSQAILVFVHQALHIVGSLSLFAHLGVVLGWSGEELALC